MRTSPNRSVLAYVLCGVLPAAVLGAFAVMFYREPLIANISVVWFALPGLAGLSFSLVVEPSKKFWPMSGFVAALLLMGVAASGTFLVVLTMVFIRDPDLHDWATFLLILIAALPTGVALHYIATLCRSFLR